MLTNDRTDNWVTMVCVCSQATKIEEKDVDFNPEFVARMIPKIDWDALRSAANDVSGCKRLKVYIPPKSNFDQE